MRQRSRSNLEQLSKKLHKVIEELDHEKAKRREETAKRHTRED
jgi:hypothetical protein